MGGFRVSVMPLRGTYACGCAIVIRIQIS